MTKGRPLLLPLLGLLWPFCHSSGEMPTARAIAVFEQRVVEQPTDFLSFTALGQLHARQARETGALDPMPRAESALRAALKIRADHFPALLDLAAVCLTLHRPAEALDLVRRAEELQPGDLDVRMVRADAELALGHYAEATKECEHLRRTLGGDHPAVLVREADLAWAAGRNTDTLRLLVQAADAAETSGLSPLDLAWHDDRVGKFHFRTGQFTKARARYAAALKRVPDYWQAAAHLAEVTAAEGRFDEALALYQKVIAATPRPELLQAIGELHTVRGHPPEALEWFERARLAYLETLTQGRVDYLHHLADLFTDPYPQPAEAVKYAREDLDLRQTIEAYDALAWALFKSGQTAEAAEFSARALATGTNDSHILEHAAGIRRAAGDTAGASVLERRARKSNPKLGTFHAHH